MKNISSVVIIIVCVLALAGLVYLSGTSANNSRSLSEITEGEHIYGNPNAEITLIEYSDFQCPACSAYREPVKNIVDKYNDKIRFVYRHYPLSQHFNAVIAAQYAEAAGKQGKFWEMYDLLFINQNEWSDKRDVELTDIYEKYAKSLNLDIDKLKIDVNDESLMKKIQDDWKSGQRVKVNWTPTFFLDEVKLQKAIPGQGYNNLSPEEIEKAIEEKINSK